MSDTDTTTAETEVADTPTTEVQPEPQSAEREPDPADDTDAAEPTADDAPSGPAAQAAKYRVRLRETEAERDALSERLNTLQCREVERLAAEHLADGADLWLSGTELTALLDEDGNVDPERVSETATALVQSRPHWAAKPRPGQPLLRKGQLKSGASLAPPPGGWATLLGRGE
ncbi:MAG: hypothetical protein ABS80_21260 [Pseudonocardia sp. SCN 72-51]|nr:MAG: hypothetical protein ABS80_21260 [Pseudonocardia sp. SCN 72-51]